MSLQCIFQGTSSKNLSRHVRETSHKSDSCEEHCYSCDKVCANFEELMQHRRNSHARIINQCRYYREGLCRYNDNCWYSHDTSASGVSKAQSNFQSQQKLPPDHIQILEKMESMTIKLNRLLEGDRRIHVISSHLSHILLRGLNPY